MGACALAAALLAGCGGDAETKTTTVVQTVTQTVTAEAPAPATVPGTETTPAAGGEVPAGVVKIDGTFAMEVRDDSYQGENTVVEDANDSDWIFTSDCTADACTIALRRELRSGTFKNLTLEPVEGRENTYEARSTGRTKCATGDEQRPAEQRYSVKVNKSEDVNGVPTATVLDAYYVEEVKGCELTGDARGTVSFRGALQR